jgi:hypothetical protein
MHQLLDRLFGEKATLELPVGAAQQLTPRKRRSVGRELGWQLRQQRPGATR